MVVVVVIGGSVLVAGSCSCSGTGFPPFVIALWAKIHHHVHPHLLRLVFAFCLLATTSQTMV